MEFIFNKTVKGFNHIKNNTVCQDYSEIYISKKTKIITACDGHGGKVYIRSDRGAKFASKAVIDVISNYSKKKLDILATKKGLDKVKLEILCKWNELVEKDYINNKFLEEEFFSLNEDDKFQLENNYVLAYGTTLNAVFTTKKYLICMQIGDGGIYLIKRNKMEIAFPENDDNVANMTNSLCGDKAYSNIFIKAIPKNRYNGIIICTDGFLSPYYSYDNLYRNFVGPFNINYRIITKEKLNILDEYIEDLGKKKGVGDDVSFACILY